MGRPRKDSNQPQAADRIVEAFWSLLERHRLKEITISMVAAEANCNRGTFYYHFADMDELVYRAIERELLTETDYAIPGFLFALLTKANDELITDRNRIEALIRLCLLIDSGGQEIVDTKVKMIMRDMWRDVLCEEDEELTTEALMLIEYSAGGMLSLMSFICRAYREGRELPTALDVEGIQPIVMVQLRQLARCQNIEPNELLMRLRMYDKFLKSNR